MAIAATLLGSRELTTSATSTTVSATSTNGATWVVWAADTVGFGATPITDNKGNTYTQIGTNVASFGVTGTLWYKANGTGGASHVFTATPSSNDLISMIVVEITGGDSAPLDVFVTGTVDSATPFTSGTTAATSVPNSVVLAFDYDNRTAGTITWGNGYTSLVDLSSTVGISAAAAKLNITAAGAQQSSLTGTLTSAVTWIATFKEAGSAVVDPSGAIRPSTSKFPGRGPRNRSVRSFNDASDFGLRFLRPSNDVFTPALSTQPAAPQNIAEKWRQGENRPGRGPYSLGAYYRRPIDVFDSTGSPATVALTSVTGTGAAGNAGVTVDKALTSATGTGNTGTLAPVIDKAVTNAAGASAVGTVTPNTAPAITTVAGAGAVGALGVSVTVALTGVIATGNVGNVTVQGSSGAALTGVGGTGSVGTLGVAADKALTNVVGTGALGTVTPGTSPALTSNAGAGSVGNVSPNVTVALAGVSASGAAGDVGVSGNNVTVALTGVSATGQVGTVSALRSRGFNFASRAAQTKEDFAAAAGYGANLVRVAVLPTLDAGGLYQVSAADLAYVRLAVQSARCYGFKVAVTMAPQPGLGASDWWGNAPKSNSLKAIWAQIAALYVGDPVIYGYDLLNEPWLTTTLDDWYKSATQTGLAVEMVDAIRAVDPNAPCIFEPGEVGGSGSKAAAFWPGGTPLVPLARANIIYSYHFYDPPELTFQGILGYPAPLSYPTVYPYTQAYLSDVMQYIRLFTTANPGVQMYCGEFSCIRSAPGATATNWLSDAIALFATERHDWTYHSFREYQGFDPEIPLGPLATPGARTSTAEVITLLRGVLPGALPGGVCSFDTPLFDGGGLPGGSHGTVGMGPFAPRVYAERTPLVVSQRPQIVKTARAARKPQPAARIVTVQLVFASCSPIAFASEPLKPALLAELTLIRTPTPPLIRSTTGR